MDIFSVVAKCQHWITDVWIIRNKYWKICQYCIRIRLVNHYHRKFILTQKKDLGLVLLLWSFLF